MSALLNFIEWIVAPGQSPDEAHCRREQFYRRPTETMVDQGLVDAEEQALFCGLNPVLLWRYLAGKYGAAEERRARVLLADIDPDDIYGFEPHPSKLELGKDPWAGQPCGQEEPCQMVEAEIGHLIQFRILWGAPRRRIEAFLPNAYPHVGQTVRLVASGEGLRPGLIIKLTDLDQRRAPLEFPTNLFCERAFTGCFVGVCVEIRNGMDGEYRVDLCDPFGRLPVLEATPYFRIDA